MSDTLELRTLSVKELADRADALEQEAALLRALQRARAKQERDRAQLARAIAAANADEERRREAAVAS